MCSTVSGGDPADHFFIRKSATAWVCQFANSKSAKFYTTTVGNTREKKFICSAVSGGNPAHHLHHPRPGEAQGHTHRQGFRWDVCSFLWN